MLEYPPIPYYLIPIRGKIVRRQSKKWIFIHLQQKSSNRKRKSLL